jgi:hypothetical protein
MLARLIDVRVHNFISNNSNEEVRGYRTSFIIPSRHPDQYAPTLVLFYVCDDDRRGHGRILRELLDGKNYLTSLDGIADFEIGYVYSADKKVQSLTYLDKIEK